LTVFAAPPHDQVWNYFASVVPEGNRSYWKLAGEGQGAGES